MPSELLGRHFIVCVQELRLHCSAGVGLRHLFFNLISRGAELLYRATHPSGEFGQFLRPKQKQHDEKDYHHVRPDQIRNTSDDWSHKVFE